MNIKTRFAPSPTGSLHIGNIRTALYAWLYARSQRGKFLLRIEDTNINRLESRNAVENIISIMKWLNLDWDEGPVFQTDRVDRYNNIIDDMIQYSMAYRCYCSTERLNQVRLAQMKYGNKPKYDGRCRMISSSTYITVNAPYVVRFCNPVSGKVVFYDKIRGAITFYNQELDDVIIRRSNGLPTYNFCVAVDDMDMKISHVIRGEEHINNTPRQINILQALNATIPIYAHVPMILNEDRKKISKRLNAEGIMHYQENGFLPEAILNYLVRLGWSYGDKEIFSIEQMKKYFDIKGISKSSSVFNLKKLLWLNKHYMSNLPSDYVASHLLRCMNQKNINYKNGPKLSDIIKLFSKRFNTLTEIAYHCRYLYGDLNVFKNKFIKKYLTSILMLPLKVLRNKLCDINTWDLLKIKFVIMDTMNELNINISTIGPAIRVVLTGVDKSPELSTVIFIMGKYQVLRRIDQAMLYINQNM